MRQDVALAYEVDLEAVLPSQESLLSHPKIKAEPNLGLIRYESFYLKTGMLLLKIGDGKSLTEAIRWYNEIHRFFAFL
ncbi:MAG: hypothetical protein LBD69_04550 [Puniceicoccales bacterium]|jgi:hypothetical protein|nr:hypothetical protein [Puniceicoccales bacterium]